MTPAVPAVDVHTTMMGSRPAVMLFVNSSVHAQQQVAIAVDPRIGEVPTFCYFYGPQQQIRRTRCCTGRQLGQTDGHTDGHRTVT